MDREGCRRAPAGAPGPEALTGAAADAAASATAESIRLDLAEAWGDMGAAWGVTPAIARVQAYLMARQEPLTEREVREALGLSHRAASLALAEAESWGIVERVPEPRRVGRRGPAGTAYLAVGDHWQWFGRVIAERKMREGDPIVAVLETKAAEAATAAAVHPDDAELAALRDWLASFVVFVRLFDRAVGPRAAARAARARALAATCSAASRTRRSCGCSTCSAASTTTTCSSWSRRCRASRRRPPAARRS